MGYFVSCWDYLKKKTHFLVVGSGNTSLVSHLKEKVREYKLDSIVTFTGYLPGDSKNIIAGFDILLMPTIDFEGFGYSMAEGMAANLPVVASNVGAIPEVIEDGISGLLIEPSDIEGWSICLERLAKDKNKRNQIGIAAKERIQKEFSAKKMSQLYFEYINA